MMHAVITADIVNSTKLSPARERKLLDTIGEVLAGAKLEFYRGDSFQSYIKDAGDALRILLLLRCAAIRLGRGSGGVIFDLRASIGVGSVSAPVKRLAAAKGEAFVLSGRAFDEVELAGRRLVISAAPGVANTALKLAGDFLDYIFSRLTVMQAAVLFELLSGQTQIAISHRLKKSQGTINKHVQSSGWAAIKGILEDYQQLVKQLS